MSANAQRDGRPAAYRWRACVQRPKVWLTPTARVPCSNAANIWECRMGVKWILHPAKFIRGKIPRILLYLCPACSCSIHMSSLCQLTTLNPLFLSLPPQDLPLSQIFPIIDSLPAPGLTPRSSRPDRFFWASPFFGFIVSSLFFILFGSVRQINLATRQLSGARTLI